MIIYFSATGNNQYLATTIAEQINEKHVSMITLNQNEENEIKLEDHENLGIITPTYFLGLPRYVEEFLSKTKIIKAKDNYTFIITSYGTSPGYSAGYIKDYLEEQNITTHAQYSIKMPDTWTPIFDVSNQQKNNQTNKEAEKELETIISNIKNKKTGNYLKRKVPKFIANISQIMYDNQRKTSHLKVKDTCTMCGKCINNCPINAITSEDDKIKWVTERCIMCLRCLHNCPEFAIQYDNKTQKHGQYTNPNITQLD